MSGVVALKDDADLDVAEVRRLLKRVATTIHAAPDPVRIPSLAAREPEVRRRHVLSILDLDPAVRTYLAVMALLWLIWLVTAVASGAWYPWPVWPMLGWGVGVAGRFRGDPARP